MPKGVLLKEYSGEFKQMVVETVRAEGLSHREAMRRFEIGGAERIKKWERIYLEEGKAEGLAACYSQTTSPSGGLIKIFV